MQKNSPSTRGFRVKPSQSPSFPQAKASYSSQDKEDITENETIAAVLPAHRRKDSAAVALSLDNGRSFTECVVSVLANGKWHRLDLAKYGFPSQRCHRNPSVVKSRRNLAKPKRFTGRYLVFYPIVKKVPNRALSSCLATQSSLGKLALPGAPSTTAMTTNLTRLTVESLPRSDRETNRSRKIFARLARRAIESQRHSAAILVTSNFS